MPPTREAIRVVPGPQSDLFDDDFWEALTGGAWAIAPASDRMGYRLDGPAIRHRGSPSMPSEPVCPGAMQVPVGGTPIVLMPDGPTVGGYPKPAAVITADAGQLAQSRPGARPRFELVTFEEAVSALREVHARRRAAREFLSRSST
jgi:allophanate hydrolase